MKEKVFFILIFFSLSLSSFSQKSIFLELAGTGGIGSFNYESLFTDNNNLNFSYRLGISATPIDKNNGVAIVFPLMINGQVGKTKHKLDFGIGQSISISTKGRAFVLGTAMLGYRLTPEKSNYYFTFRYTPVISYLIDFQWQDWGGIGIGYKF